jgi:hypothetical protein
VVLFFFQKKEEKSFNWLYSSLLFPEKEAKSVVLLRRRLWATQTLAKQTLGVSIGLAVVFFYQKKKQKA